MSFCRLLCCITFVEVIEVRTNKMMWFNVADILYLLTKLGRKTTWRKIDSKGRYKHIEPIGSPGLAFWSWKAIFGLDTVHNGLLGPKHYFMYENINLNNNVITTQVYCTNALNLVIFKQILFLPLSKYRSVSANASIFWGSGAASSLADWGKKVQIIG